MLSHVTSQSSHITTLKKIFFEPKNISSTSPSSMIILMSGIVCTFGVIDVWTTNVSGEVESKRQKLNRCTFSNNCVAFCLLELKWEPFKHLKNFHNGTLHFVNCMGLRRRYCGFCIMSHRGFPHPVIRVSWKGWTFEELCGDYWM